MNTKAIGHDGGNWAARCLVLVGRVLVALLVLVAIPNGDASAAPDDKSDGPEAASSQKRRPGDLASDPVTMREVLRNERRAVQSEKAELEQLRVDLKNAEAALDSKIEAMKALVEKKQKLIEQVKSLRETVMQDKLARLVRLAEKMPAPEAAAYLSRLDEPTASSILQGMRVRQASKVMAALHPKKAASLSRTYLKHDKPVGRRPDRNQPRR